MREGTTEAISLDGNVIFIIENREGEFVMLRQIEEGDTKREIIIPKDMRSIADIMKLYDICISILV